MSPLQNPIFQKLKDEGSPEKGDYFYLIESMFTMIYNIET